MKRKTIIFMIGLALSSLSVEAQDTGYDHVVFTLDHSKRIPDHKVRIEFTSQGGKTTVRVKSEPMERHFEVWKQTVIDTTFNISAEEYEKVWISIFGINYFDISPELTVMGVDGSTTSIEHGNLGSSITYIIWSPAYQTKKRKLQTYLHSCETIIKAAGLDPKKIL